MNARLPLALAAVVLAGALGAPAAAHAQDARDMREVRAAVREAVRDATRSVNRALRDVSRSLRDVDRHELKAVGRELRAAGRELRLRGERLRLSRERSSLQVRSRSERLAERSAERRPDRLSERLSESLSLALSGGFGALQDPDADPCADNAWGGDDGARHCEVRESTLPAGPLAVDAGRNGGIRVEAWDRNEIRVQAIVQTRAANEARAREIAGAVEVQAGGGRVSARGPSRARNESWAVGYHIMVPRATDLDLDASNGGITIAGVSGDIRFDTSNGGVRLSDLGGTVRGETTNGGLHVVLAGDRWAGSGRDVRTTNGGVKLEVPQGYNALLETRTVNGGFRTDIPLTVTGELSTRRGVTATLGDGGPPVRVRTTNGGLRINRR